MATATVGRRADGIANSVSGSFTGDGAATTITLGFNPMRMLLINTTDAIKFEKVDGQPAADSLKTVAVGTQTEDATSAILFNGNGTVTINAATGITAKVFAWIAHR